MNLVEAAQKNDKRLAMEMLRDKIAQKIEDDPGARDLASLSKRFMEVCDIIDMMPEQRDEPSPIEIARQAIRKNGA